MRTPGTDWQNRYTAEEAHWEDMRNIFRLILVLVGVGFAIPALAAVIFIITSPPARGQNLLGGFLAIGQIVLSVFLPLTTLGIGIGVVYRFARRYFQGVYAPPEGTSIGQTIMLRVFGLPPLPPPLDEPLNYPYILFRDGRPTKPQDQAFWVGGPRRLIILDGTAVYIERCNLFSRVVGPGVAFLERHEIVTHTLDLRPQTYEGTVKAWTKDGIEVEAKVRITCRIGAQSNLQIEPPRLSIEALPEDVEVPQSPGTIYPFDAEAVRKAVEWTKVKRRFTSDGAEELYDAEWLEGAWGQVQGDLAVYISQRHIDSLFTATKEQPSGGLLLSQVETERIRADLDSRLQKDAGVSLMDLQITEFKITNEVLAKRVEKWKTDWEVREDIRKAHSEAEEIKAEESAKAEAQRDLILQIAEGLSKVDQEDFSSAVLLTLSGFLDQSMGDPSIQADLARETLETLEKIQEMLKD